MKAKPETLITPTGNRVTITSHFHHADGETRLAVSMAWENPPLEEEKKVLETMIQESWIQAGGTTPGKSASAPEAASFLITGETGRFGKG